MSRIICAAAIRGAHSLAKQAGDGDDLSSNTGARMLSPKSQPLGRFQEPTRRACVALPEVFRPSKRAP